MDIEETSEDNVVYVWTGGTCDYCAGMEGTILDGPDAPDAHKNCGCTAEAMTMDDYILIYGSIDESKQRKYNEIKTDNRFRGFMGRIMRTEGGYEDRPSRIDEPTNMGVRQTTLDSYRRKNGRYDFPKDVKDLTPKQAKEIYRNTFFDPLRIAEIKNDRIAYAFFDIGVHSGQYGATKILQKAVNEYYGFAKLDVDGAIGKNTLDSLNQIENDQVDSFMDIFLAHRQESMKNMDGYDMFKRGWIERLGGL
jgi:hypothetical protein